MSSAPALDAVSSSSPSSFFSADPTASASATAGQRYAKPGTKKVQKKIYYRNFRASVELLEWSPYSSTTLLVTLRDSSVWLWEMVPPLSSSPSCNQKAPRTAQGWQNETYWSGSGTCRELWSYNSKKNPSPFNPLCKSNSIRWHPRQGNLIASGQTDGQVRVHYLVGGPGGQERQAAEPPKRRASFSFTGSSSSSPSSSAESEDLFFPPPEKTVPKSETPQQITDLSWDPLSTSYLLTLSSRNCLTLLDISTKTTVRTFSRVEPASHSLFRIFWLPSSPGNFGGVSSRTGVVKIWNVSQDKPIDHLRVGAGGFVGFEVLASDEVHSQPGVGAGGSQPCRVGDRCITSFSDGSICVYNLLTKHRSFVSKPGHTETVFDCKFSPSSPYLLATSSYDSTIKIWETKTMTLRTVLTGQEGVIYSMSWDRTGSGLVSCSINGTVNVWDLRGKVGAGGPAGQTGVSGGGGGAGSQSFSSGAFSKTSSIQGSSANSTGQAPADSSTPFSQPR